MSAIYNDWLVQEWKSSGVDKKDSRIWKILFESSPLLFMNLKEIEKLRSLIDNRSPIYRCGSPDGISWTYSTKVALAFQKRCGEPIWTTFANKNSTCVVIPNEPGFSECEVIHYIEDERDVTLWLGATHG